ncbi:MAG: DUF3791 domain-containing protein [Defluviitaleaceae bacterium]|nr:DUF3791 domain-containing protein [Defluviitaleaceae bacterium]
MNYKKIVNPILFLQAHFSRLFMERHSLTPDEFLALDKDKDIIGFIRLSYEPFHLTGDEWVLEEIDRYVFRNNK